MSDEKSYAGLMGERLARPNEGPTTTRPRQGPKHRPPLEALRPPRDLDVRIPGVPTEPAGAGVVSLIAILAVAALIALGRLGGPPTPLPAQAPTVEVAP
jgi:hypothetical protein